VSALERVVVVGASLAGLRTAEALRKRGYAGTLTLVGDEPHAPYDRPPLSKQVLTGEWDASRVFFRQKEGYEGLAAELVLGRRALSLDARERRVLLDDGRVLEYDGLVIATGCRPRALPRMAELAGVFSLRTLDDALALRRALVAGARVVVVGAGFIGLEVAAACRKLGVAVTVVEAMTFPLVSILGEAVGEAVTRLHVEHGVAVRVSTTVLAIEGEGRVERVRLSDGSVLDTDAVVVGIGVTPAIEWLQGSGIALGDGVLCDAACATNLPHVVAAGDVARFHNSLFDESMRVEHWSNAVDQAQAAAAHLLADTQTAPAFQPVPYFWSDQYDRKFQFAGRALPTDELHVVEGALHERAFTALYGRAGRLRAVLTCNRPQQAMRYRKLLSERASFEAALALGLNAAGSV